MATTRTEWTAEGLDGLVLRTDDDVPLARVRSTLGLDGRVLAGSAARPPKASGYVPPAIAWTASHTMVMTPRYEVMIDGSRTEGEVAAMLQRLSVVDWTERQLH